MTNNPIIHYINQTIDYIEDHIKEDLNIDIISRDVHLSRSYLQRIFKSVTGTSLKDYARSRKLTCILELLKETDLTLVEIAEMHHYKYEQSFSRAFKSYFGISPKHYRDNPVEVPITPKMNVDFLIDLEDGVILKPVFVDMPTFDLGGTVHQVTIDEKFQYKPTQLAIKFFFEEKDKIINPVTPHVYYGYTFKHEHPLTTNYLTSVRVDENSILPEGFKRITIKESKYIVFKFIGNFSAENITWEHLDGIWKFRDYFLESYQMVNDKPLGYFEYIDQTLSTDDYCELDIYVPIK